MGEPETIVTRDGPQLIQTTSLTEIIKELRQGQSSFATYFHMNMEESPKTAPPDMQKLVKEYATIFQDPSQLPPS